MFQLYKRIAPIYAKQLSAFDVEEMGGKLISREKISTIEPGDYMARDSAGVYKIAKQNMEDNYVSAEVTDSEGFSMFLRKHPYEWAEQQPAAFTVGKYQGQAGDFKVTNYENTHYWVVAPNVYLNSRVQIKRHGKPVILGESFDVGA